MGSFPIVAVHLPSPHEGISEILNRSTLVRPSRRETMQRQVAVRCEASEEASRWIADSPGPAIVAGDFNTPPDSPVYRQCWARFSNAFSCCGIGYGYTEWPTVCGWRFGIRIDHILAGPGWQPLRCWVGADVGSDHLPVIADIGWQGSSTGGDSSAQ